jgi:uracil-DNA glycosylase
MERGFFPGGNGLFDGELSSRFPFDGTLVLGSNFGSADKFVGPDGRLITLDETSNNTWAPLRRLLGGAEIDLRNCFFTNAWPCLHEGRSNTVNKLIPGWLANAELMGHCAKFFARTCADMKPSLIVALGPGPAAFLASTWQQELDAWSSNAIGGIDRLPIGIVQLEGVEHKTVCIAVVHPSYQHINAKLRRPPYQNAEGEILLLKKAHELSRAALREAPG